MSSLWFEAALLPGGWSRHVRLIEAGGRIGEVRTDVDPDPGDERHGIGLPGLPNLHSHAFQRGIAGLTERRGPADDSFWTWRELMYQFVERMDPDELQAITELAFAEMLEAGFTHVGEFHYLHHDRAGMPFADPGELSARVVAAAAETGIGLTLLPVFYAHSGFGGRAPGPRQARFINDLERFAQILESARQAVRALPGAVIGIAPHSLRAVTPEELSEVVGLAERGVIHLHIAEQTKEIEDCLAWSGRRPIEWLLDAQPVDARWCLVHATHATPEELRGIARSGAVVGLCPITEANLGDGIFPAPEFLSYGGQYGIGSDSNIRLDAAEELRTLEYSQRLAQRARNVLASTHGQSTGHSLFAAALAGGSQALQSARGSTRQSTKEGAVPQGLGGLQIGASLDVVSLLSDHPSLIERREDEILDSWIFAGGRGAVDCVWRGGAKVVTHGRHHRRDAIMARYARAQKSLLA